MRVAKWIIAGLVALLAFPALAQGIGKTLAEVDQSFVQDARAGDPTAAYWVAMALVEPWQEPNIRAALPWIKQAYDGSAEGRGMDPDMAVATTLNYSNMLEGLSEYRAALDLAIEAERRYLALPADYDSVLAPVFLAYALERQAVILQKLSLYSDSIPLLQKVRAIGESQPVPDDELIANSWLNEGLAYEGLKQLPKALEAYYNGLAIYKRLFGNDSAHVGYAANNIGWVLTLDKEYADAQGWLELALSIIERHEGSFSENAMKVRINLGLIAVEQGKADVAIYWGMKAMPYITANRGQTVADQRWTFELLSRAFALQDNADRAIFFGKLAVNAQQEFRATNTLTAADTLADSQREWGRLYSQLADLMIAEGRISEAQAVLNMGKEEEVFQFLQRDTTAKLTETRAVLTDAELGDEAKLAALARAPVAAEQELQALMVKIEAGAATPADEDQVFLLQDALQVATDDFDAAVAGFLAAAPPETQASLDAQFDAVGSYQAVLADLPRPTAILQVAALDHATHLFLTLPGVTLHQEVAIERGDLARMVFEALDAVAGVAPDAKDKLAALEQVLFAPVDQALRDAGTEVVMLNLDGFLRYVPFAALHDGQGYLVERFAFSLYSTAVPTQFDRALRVPKATAGFGVTQAHPGFAALPGVAAELDTIFGPVGVLGGETALDAGFDERSLKKVLLHKPEILHIASHFSLVPGREDDSFLLLGDGSHLALSKIRSTRALRFQGVDLLTLSACQTARGGDGAEIDGFGATAQLNGAAAVMASLWPVSDAATPRLMRDFYQAMMVDGLDKAESLRRAQLAMLKGGGDVTVTADRQATALDDASPKPKIGFDHPYFWSAFVLMGNWL